MKAQSMYYRGSMIILSIMESKASHSMEIRGHYMTRAIAIFTAVGI